MRRALLLLALALVGCGPPGEGTFLVQVNGEDRVVTGFPPSLLKDGWGLNFSRYVVSVGQLALTSGGERLERPGAFVVDLASGARELFRWTGVPAGRWQVEFTLAPPPADAEVLGVDPATVAELRARGWAYFIEGQATRVGVGTFPLSVGLPVAHRYTGCTNGVDGTLGLVVGDGATEVLELTVHAEHMLYDRLGTHRGINLRFEAWTAMDPPGTPVTLASLARQDILALKDRAGQPLRDADGSLVVYDPGAFDVRTLEQFVARSLVDMAHLNGGGLCTVTALPDAGE